MSSILYPKRPSRKKKVEPPPLAESVAESVVPPVEPTLKKSRKPPAEVKRNVVSVVPRGGNLILHLKCKMSQLYEYQKMIKKFETNSIFYEPTLPTNEIVSYEETVSHQYAPFEPTTDFVSIPTQEQTQTHSQTLAPTESVGDIYEICAKLKTLKLQLHKNVPVEKPCACFWCSYDYTTPLCYIPKHIINDTVYGYGSFCSPQCATAYLMKESVDDTTRYERYYLLNTLYGNGSQIKPSPCPYYTLNKYYGNLSIEEYRKLIKTDHFYVIVEKPMTRIYPEIHEETEEILMGGSNKIMVASANTSRIYKVKMQNEGEVKKPAKIDPFQFLMK